MGCVSRDRNMKKTKTKKKSFVCPFSGLGEDLVLFQTKIDEKRQKQVREGRAGGREELRVELRI